MTRIVLLPLLTVFLIACGGGGGGSGGTNNISIEPDRAIYGTWESEGGNTFLYIENNALNDIRFDNVYECYLSNEIDILFPEDDHLKIVDSSFEYDFVINDDELTLQEPKLGIEFIFTRSQRTIDSFEPLCSDETAIGSVTAEISFANLSDQIIVNGSPSYGALEYGVWIDFDINLNGIKDTGDVMFQLSSYRIAGEEESTINIEDLTANLWLVTEYESDGSSSTTTSSLHSEISFSVDTNTISFSVPKSLHIAIQAISQATPISVESVYSFGEQGHERDSFPDLTDYTVGVDTSLLNDAIGDVNDAASEIIDGNTIVDIVEVSITVTD